MLPPMGACLGSGYYYGSPNTVMRNIFLVCVTLGPMRTYVWYSLCRYFFIFLLDEVGLMFFLPWNFPYQITRKSFLSDIFLRNLFCFPFWVVTDTSSCFHQCIVFSVPRSIFLKFEFVLLSSNGYKLRSPVYCISRSKGFALFLNIRFRPLLYCNGYNLQRGSLYFKEFCE